MGGQPPFRLRSGQAPGCPGAKLPKAFFPDYRRVAHPLAFFAKGWSADRGRPVFIVDKSPLVDCLTIEPERAAQPH